jgi:hypothetical protein
LAQRIMKVIWLTLFTLAVFAGTAAAFRVPMSAGMVKLVKVQTERTPPDWHAP